MALDGRYLMVNASLCRMLGYTESELLSQTCEQITHPTDRIREAPLLAALIRGERKFYEIEKRYIHRDGSYVWVSLTSSPVSGPSGELLFRVSVIQDITERRQAGESLRISEERHRVLAETMLQGVVHHDADGKIIAMNPAAERILGRDQEDFLGSNFFQQDPGIIREDGSPIPAAERPAMLALRTGHPVHGMVVGVLNPRQGAYRWISIAAVPLFHPRESRPYQVYTLFEDVTERKQAAEALAGLQRLYESGLLGVMYWNLNGQILDANDRFLEMVGYTREDLKAGRIDWGKMTPTEYRHLDERSIEELKATGANKVPFEKEYFRKDGTRVPILIAGAMLDEVRFNGVAFTLDITARKQAEQRVAHLATFPELNSEPIFESDLNGKVTYANPRALSLFPALMEAGADHPLLRQWPSVVASLKADPKASVVREIESDGLIFQQRIRYAPGLEVMRAYFSEITEQKRADEELREEKATLQGILDATGESIWLINSDCTVLLANSTALKRVGKPAGEVIGKTIRELIAPSLAGTRSAHVRQVVETAQPLQVEDERDGMIFRNDYYPVLDSHGSVSRVVAFSRDITERRHAEQTLRRYELMAGHTRDIVLFIRYEDGRILEANEAAVMAYGYTREKLKLMTIQELREPLTRQRAPGEMSLAEKQGILFESIHLRADGSTFPVEVSSQGATVAGTRTLISIVRDITERKQAEEQLQKINRILNARNSSNQALLHATDEPAYLHEVCRIVTEDCGYVMMWIGFAEHDKYKTIRPVASAGFEEGYLEKLKVTWADNERGQGPSGTAIRSGKASMCRNVRTDPAFLPWREEAIKRGYFSSLVIPFTTANGAVGAFSIYAREPEAFSDEEVSMLSDLAADLAFGVNTLRLRAAHSQAEEQLHESEERYRNLFNSMDEGFCIVEMIFDSEDRATDYRFLKVNEAFEAQTGLHDAEGKLMRELAPAHEAHWFETYGRIALTGEPAHFLNEARALNRYYDVHAYRVGEAEQRQVAIVFNDISGIKRAEEEREATIEFLGLVNLSQGTKDLIHKATIFFQERSGCEAVGIRLREGDDYPYFETRGFSKQFVIAENKLCVLDTAGKAVRDRLCNPILECMCGSVIGGRFDPSKPFFTAQGCFWTNSTSELLASTTEVDRQSRTRNRCNGEGYESVALFPLHDGEERFGLLQLNDPQKGRFSAELIVLWERLTAYLATALSKFRAEEALHQSEAQFRTLADSIPQLAWMANADGWIFWYNQRWYSYTGTTSEQMEGWGWQSVHDPDELPKVMERWKRSIASGEPFDMVFPLRGADGVFRPFLTRIMPLFDSQGVVVRWFGTNTDISAQKQGEQALLRSEKLASVGRMAAAIAHEINNPLGAVTNLLYLAKDAKELPESSRQYLEMADAELKRIAHIARQSLGFYRESSAPALTSVNATLESAVELLKSKIAAKHAVIQKRWETEVTVTAISGELRQVFSNLLANSLDAIDDGGTIQLRICAGVDHDNQRRCVRITIADNGKGIAAESRQHIFEPFFTTKGSIGTGLGLWVSKEIVDKHQGRIRLHSTIDGARRGTVFTIVLPAEDATPMPSKPAK